jgi:YfiH family protein
MSAWEMTDGAVPTLRWRKGGENVLAAVSTRVGGVSPAPYDSLNLGRSTGDTDAHVDANRARFVDALGARDARLARIHQVHGADVLHVDRAWQDGGDRPRADGLVTQDRDRLLVVTVADCAPVFVAHEASGTVAAVHAGWRGTAARIAAVAVERVAALAGVSPRELTAGVGPSIGPCCFEVGEDVASHFPHATVRRPGAPRPFVDLWEANAAQLEAAGLPYGSISVAGLCTSCCVDLFFSHRRDHGVTGRMIAVIGRGQPRA